MTETISRTQEKFNSLTNDLNETSIIVDNITNASLALANTQFIESRVHEDDIETKPPQITEGQVRWIVTLVISSVVPLGDNVIFIEPSALHYLFLHKQIKHIL